jgi:hypothetical protein
VTAIVPTTLDPESADASPSGHERRTPRRLAASACRAPGGAGPGMLGTWTDDAGRYDGSLLSALPASGTPGTPVPRTSCTR